MKIILDYGPSAMFAPQGFTSAMAFAAQQFDALITDNVTVTIQINWDLTDTILGEAGPVNGGAFDYSTVVAALQAHATSPAAKTAAMDLPASDPTGGAGLYLTEAQSQALGLTSGTAPLDGTATFGDPFGVSLNFSTTNLAVPGQVDFLGVAEHELAHALGRSGWGDGSAYSLMDMFRFASAGVLETQATIGTATSPPAYFSIDGGHTNLASFSTFSDYYDWASAVPKDSFDAIATIGQANTLSALDQTLLSAIGFNVACFCPGTRIATPRGEVAVERLTIGDAVITASGPRRIKWIGRSDYDGRFLGNNPLMLPVTFAPGALGEGVPARPLSVSPGHGICLGAALVPAWRLVNGVSVTQPTQVAHATYLHIEMDEHTLLLSEGAWSESFYAEVPRSWFQNGAQYAALYPDEEVRGPPCLPLVADGVALAARQHFVNHRAGLAPAVEGTGTLRGHVDRAGPDLCAGWAQSLDAPEAPVTLLVMRGGEILARVLANAYRADLRAAGLGSGCHGFSVPVPTGTGAIVVCRALDGAVLARAGQARAA